MSKPQKTGKKLTYSIFKISSEDDNFPGTELMSSDKYCKGWQSQRFCSNPQIILIQFPSTVRVRLVQFLCHEYKIPSEIELVAITKGGEKSMRLGSFKLQDNHSTQYRSRELKSVYVEVDCKYLKLILYKAHANTKNLFSQVALMSLTVYGDFIGYEGDYVENLKTVDPLGKVSGYLQPIERNLHTPQENSGNMYFSQSGFMSRQSRLLNDMIGDKMKVLNNEMKNAKISNDMDKAKKLKKVIDKTVKLSKLAKELEFNKFQAIDNEDYESAKIIKAELDKVKKNLMSISTLPSMRGSALSSRGSIRTPTSEGRVSSEDRTNPSFQLLQSISQIESDLKRVNVNFEKSEPSTFMNHNFKVNNTYDESIGNMRPPQPMDHDMVQMRPDSRQINPQRVPTQHSMSNQAYVQSEYPQEEFGPDDTLSRQQFDETVIPMHNKDPIDFNKIKDDKEDSQKGGETEEEKLNAQDKSKIDIMKQYYDEDTLKLLHSKKWQNRKKGLESFIGQMPSSLKEHGIAAQEHAINIFFSSCKEKLSQLSELSMKLFEELLAVSKSAGFELKFDSSKVSQMIMEVLDKRELDIIKDKVLTGGFFDFNQISSFILSERSYKNKRFITSDVHILARLELMNFMIEKSEEFPSKKQFPLSEILEYSISKLAHPNKDLRNNAKKIVVQMYQKSGWYYLEAHIKRSVPQNQLQNLIKDIPEVKSLMPKKDPHKGSQGLREALKAVKEASQVVEKSEPKKKKK
ncbi:unnamed protein product [Moneuplotes crassus]|uniref:TOG domain-containing protein n=1 Tax=Euplotes crassus TaxID=5936 RepID=A0AAD1YBF4_EUPCR|nr:unnamed protein product [Moneuplotes crassus]